MANKTSDEQCDTHLKKGKVVETQNKLAQKLQLDFERDLLRLFQDSLYCDIKLTVDSSSVLTHSCILKTRACRFYKFIHAEFKFFIQNGISIFNIYNASFTQLQSFVENIYTNVHTSKAEDCIIKHLQEIKTYSSRLGTSAPHSVKSAVTPESDLFFTPKCSPSELQKSFTPSKLKLQENNVASYYKIVSDDDIPIDEKLDEHKFNTEGEQKLLEKELAEQDELFSSFKTIFSKKTKIKPNSLSLGTSSQSAKKSKPKFNKKFEANFCLYEDHDKGKYKLPLWKPSPVGECQNRRNKYSSLKISKNSSKYQNKIDSEANFEVENSLCGSDMDVSTTGGDSGLDISSLCQQETSPRENTVSETSGVDLTEAAINEEIPNDETISTKQSTGSSASSEVGTWDTNDDCKTKFPILVSDNELVIKDNLNEEEILRLDEMDKNIRDCEIFLLMERQGSLCGDSHYQFTHSMANEKPAVPPLDEISNKETTYQYAEEENVMNKSDELLQGKIGHHPNNDEEENYYNHSFNNERNSDDAIASRENLNDVNITNKNYEDLNANESLKQGASNDLILNSNFNYFTQPDVQETKTPPCTPKKIKVEKKEENEKQTFSEDKPKNWECNNSTGVSNYFIDASSLLDEDEIISPPISLINFKSLQNCEETEPQIEKEKEESISVCKKVVSNFFNADSTDDLYLKEQERRQGEIIFKNSIPHFSKHEVEGNHILESTERLRGGADHYNMEVVEDENEQVVPSGEVIEFNPTDGIVRQNPQEPNCAVETHFFEPASLSEKPTEYLEEDHIDGNREIYNECQANPSSRESVKDSTSTSVCSGSPNFRRRNESAPILSGGMDFVEEEKKVQKKPIQSQGEAWVVTFDDNKRPRNRFTSSDTGSETESGRENGEEKRTPSFSRSYSREPRQTRRNEPSVEFFVKEPYSKKTQEDIKSEPKVNPVEKSSSFGYFLDFGKEQKREIVEEKSEQPVEKKKNMFSMFIGMDDNSKTTFTKKPKPVLEKENNFVKSLEENQNEPVECLEDAKKSFYMFIESDSPNVNRKKIPKKLSQPVENSARKTYMRTQSYTIDRQPDYESSKPENKTLFECSSSDNSLPYIENENKTFRSVKGSLPLNKFRGITQEPKITAWSETKVPNDSSISSESWLKTKDIQVNYTGKNDQYKNDVYLKKDSTFIMDYEYKEKQYDKHTHNSLKNSKEIKSPKRDSGIVLNEKNDDSFVKLSDLNNSDNTRSKQSYINNNNNNISEETNRKSSSIEEISFGKSLKSEEDNVNSAASSLYDRQANQSLSRLFPNMSAQSLASIDKAETERNEVQMSETSEVSSSMQSSVEPTGLEISTSETDVSTHVVTTSRLGEDLLKMFLEEISPDVIVEVNGRRIKAHKCILSSRCQYFAAMLSGGWVESAGNVISLQGFSYNAVHFALRHIYSGESRIPESLNIVELATLADLLCLDGLQEIISYNLKVKYCHSFHVPCSVCSVGVIDCLPITAAYGLDDLYRKCLRWITKYFVKLWPTKNFASLPKELLEKCYQHYVVHMTVDNVLDTIVNIDKVRGSLPNVRWAESVSRLVNKLHDATLRYIAEHFSSVLTSDNFLALGKEAGWNVSRLEDSLIETIRFLPPEQACWSHARLHRILTVATGSNPPPEMDWNENFLKLLQVVAELVENSLIKQAPRAAKSKAWRQMEPELRSRIQEAACLVLPDQEPNYRRLNHRDLHQPNIPQTAKSRNLEIRQIKLAMSQQVNRNPNTNRPLSLQIDQRPKKDSRFIPLRPSVSTSSVRKSEPIEGIRKTQSRSQILGSTILEPKKTVNPKYSEVKSRYLEPRSPQKTVTEKHAMESSQRRTYRYISSSDSSRNCSPALRSSNSRSSIPQAKKSAIGTNRLNLNSVSKSDSTSTLDSKRDRSFISTKSENASVKTLGHLTREENISTDSLCTDSLLSEKEATLRRRPGKENLGERRKMGNSTTVTKSTSNSPVARRYNSDTWSTTSKNTATKKLINSKLPNENKSNPPKRLTAGKIPIVNQNKSNVSTSKTTANRNQRNSGKTDPNLVNGNTNRRRSEVDSENNKKNSKDTTTIPSAVSRSGTFLKDEPTILKRPQVESEV